jgi:hypothetical protein
MSRYHFTGTGIWLAMKKPTGWGAGERVVAFPVCSVNHQYNVVILPCDELGGVQSPNTVKFCKTVVLVPDENTIARFPADMT